MVTCTAPQRTPNPLCGKHSHVLQAVACGNIGQMRRILDHLENENAPLIDMAATALPIVLT
jgi:hypothetical protein